MSKLFKIVFFLFFWTGQIIWAQSSWNVMALGNHPGGLNNLWGYAAKGREYALVVKRDPNQFRILEVTNPGLPQLLDTFPAIVGYMQEVETYKNYAYVNENDGPLRIFDLSFLPDSIKQVGVTETLFCHTIFIRPFLLLFQWGYSNFRY